MERQKYAYANNAITSNNIQTLKAHVSQTVIANYTAHVQTEYYDYYYSFSHPFSLSLQNATIHSYHNLSVHS